MTEIKPRWKEDKRPRLKGWAPGNYVNKCHNCGEEFCGDKRAIQCADCAYKEPEVKPRIVDGEPVCSGNECPYFADNLICDGEASRCDKTGWGKYINQPCDPALRRQRDEARNDDAAKEMLLAEAVIGAEAVNQELSELRAHQGKLEAKLEAVRGLRYEEIENEEGDIVEVVTRGQLRAILDGGES